MAENLYDVQGPPATPAAGKSFLFPHTSSKQWASKDDAGKVLSMPGLYNFNTADVVASAADTYLTGSRIDVPSHLLQIGVIFEWWFGLTKSAAGVAAPVWNVRVGTLGTTADAARLTFTGPVQTAVVDTGQVRIVALVRSIGAAGVMAGHLKLSHNLATTGLANIEDPHLQAVSAGFDMTVPNLIVGVSVNPGAAGVWTHQIVCVRVRGL